MSTQNWQAFNSLHPLVVQALKQAQFQTPTAIQQQVFTNYKYYSDFLVASQTGSGKTLAFAAPIISQLIWFSQKDSLPNRILGLILTPTRQLAQQIQKMMNIIVEKTQIRLSMIVGGLSIDKQIRIINKKKPHILIGTPGRLHELLNEQHVQFNSLKFLVIDEADRMIQLGHYVELDQILFKIFNPKLQEFYEDDFHEIQSSLKKNSNSNDFFIMQDGKKVKLNFNVHSFETDKLFQIPSDIIYNSAPQKKKQIPKQVPQKIEEEDNENWQKMKKKIFFISATLTKEFKGTKYFKKKKEVQKNTQESDYCPKLKALLSRINFNSKPKIIDQSSELFLPPKLKQCYSFCDGQLQKIGMMLCYIQELSENKKIIIFGNTIKASKRIQFYIKSVGYKSVLLHSHMLQKQRLMKLEKFKRSNVNVLISTDVAARGLDFQIDNVIQYGVPVNGDTYVHRVGRTARAGRSGEALILLSQKQANRWEQITNIVGGSRNLFRYTPPQLLMNQVKEKVQRYEWLRINENKLENKKIEKLNEMQAQELGVQVEEQKRKKIDKDEQQLHKHNLVKKVQKVKNLQQKKKDIGDGKKWKKNKLVLSVEEIKKLL